MDFEQTSTRKLIFKRKKKRVPLIYKSLSVLLYSLQGEHVVVEQKNDSEVTGVIASAGHGMDLTLADAILTSKSGIK